MLLAALGSPDKRMARLPAGASSSHGDFDHWNRRGAIDILST
jgi:hypothetical protein